MSFSRSFSRSLGKVFAVIVGGFIVGIILYSLSICPNVLANLSVDPNAQEILGGLCKSISSKADSLP